MLMLWILPGVHMGQHWRSVNLCSQLSGSHRFRSLLMHTSAMLLLFHQQYRIRQCYCRRHCSQFQIRAQNVFFVLLHIGLASHYHARSVPSLFFSVVSSELCFSIFATFAMPGISETLIQLYFTSRTPPICQQQPPVPWPVLSYWLYLSPVDPVFNRVPGSKRPWLHSPRPGQHPHYICYTSPYSPRNMPARSCSVIWRLCTWLFAVCNCKLCKLRLE